MPALFYYSASALAAISPYYTSYFKDTLHSFVLAASSIIKMITFPLSSLVSFWKSPQLTDPELQEQVEETEWFSI